MTVHGRRARRAAPFLGALVLVTVLGCAALVRGPSNGSAPETRATVAAEPPQTEPAPEPTLDAPQVSGERISPTPRAPQEGSVDDPASLFVVVNKQRPLRPADVVPDDLVIAGVASANAPVLRAQAARALEEMFAVARTEGGGSMLVQSAYRSYTTQVSVYDGWVSRLGAERADLQSARPGHSEHQTGLAVDISPSPTTCVLQACFGTTAQGRWLAANAWRFGFVLRYPETETAVTGYTYEPWHFRFVGPEAARRYHDAGATTLESFFGLPAAPTY